MGDKASAYATLGLRPGADAGAIDEAYRRLIKQHHPDAAGGDTQRAMALNQAYAQLRASAASQPTPLTIRSWRRRSRRRSLLPLLLVIASGVTAASWLSARQPPPARAPGLATAAVRPPLPGAVPSVDADAIGAAVDQAQAYAEQREWEAGATYNRTCASDLARLGSLSLLDHCVAFASAFALAEGRTASVNNTRFRIAAERLTGAAVLGDARIRAAARLAEQLKVQQRR